MTDKRLALRVRTKVTALVVGAAVAGFLVAATWSAQPASAGLAGSALRTSECAGPARGRLLSSTVLTELSSAEVAGELQHIGLADSARFGVDALRLVYCTISPLGGPAVTSGLVALPHGTSGRLPVVAYAHGTIGAKTDAPSFLGGVEVRLIPLFFASDGFAVVAPDYLGLGLSPDSHPYLHAASEASATIDLLPAADAAATRRGVRLSHRVFVSGFSQGGQAAMAIGRALQRGDGRWRLGALAPMAGPYDLAGTQFPAAVVAGRVDPAAATVDLAYVFVAWKRLYHLYSDARQVFEEPYADRVEGLFDGSHSLSAIAAALPANPSELFRPAALAMIATPSGKLAAALRDNDVCRWAPTAPTRLYAAAGDHQVVFANAQRCRQQIIDHGAAAQLIDVEQRDHIGTALASLPQIRAWFVELATR